MTQTNSFLSSQILWELDAIRYTSAPITIPHATRAFVQAIANTVNSEGITLSKFLLTLPLYAIRDGIIDQSVSPVIRDLMAKLDELVIQKENAVADHQFEIAGHLRDAQRIALAELQRMAPTPICVSPVEIVEVLRTLGFDGELPLTT